MRILLLASIISLFYSFGLAAPVKKQHIEVELLAETQSVQPGVPFWVAFRMKPDREWHTYWRNPGDAGLPPRFKWKLPSGTTISQSAWPHPEVIRAPSVTTYGYSEETLILFQFRPPNSLKPSNIFSIETMVSWAVCKEVCIAEKTLLTIDLLVLQSVPILNSSIASSFKKVRDNLPAKPTGWISSYQVKNQQVYLSIKIPDNAFTVKPTAYFFPVNSELLDHSSRQSAVWNGTTLSVIQDLSVYFQKPPQVIEGVLVLKTGDRQEPYAITANYLNDVIP